MACFGYEGGKSGTTEVVEASSKDMSTEERTRLEAETGLITRGREELEAGLGREEATRGNLYDLLGFDYEETPLSSQDQKEKAWTEREIEKEKSGEERKSDVSLSRLQSRLDELNKKQYKLSPQSENDWNRIKQLGRGEITQAEFGQRALARLQMAGSGVLEAAMTGRLEKMGPSELEGLTREIGGLQAGRLKSALAGGGEVPTWLSAEKEREQAQLHEENIRAGRMPGTTPYIQSMSAFGRNWDIREDTEKRREIETGTRNLLSTTGLMSDIRSRRTGQLITGAGLESDIQARRFGQASSFRGFPGRRLGLLASMGQYGQPGASQAFGGLAQGYGRTQQPYQYYSGLRSQEDIQTARNEAEIYRSILRAFS